MLGQLQHENRKDPTPWYVHVWRLLCNKNALLNVNNHTLPWKSLVPNGHVSKFFQLYPLRQDQIYSQKTNWFIANDLPCTRNYVGRNKVADSSWVCCITRLTSFLPRLLFCRKWVLSQVRSLALNKKNRAYSYWRAWHAPILKKRTVLDFS